MGGGESPPHDSTVSPMCELCSVVAAHLHAHTPWMQFDRTALHLAAYCGHTDVAQALLRAGADMDLTDEVINFFMHTYLGE